MSDEPKGGEFKNAVAIAEISVQLSTILQAVQKLETKIENDRDRTLKKEDLPIHLQPINDRLTKLEAAPAKWTPIALAGIAILWDIFNTISHWS